MGVLDKGTVRVVLQIRVTLFRFHCIRVPTYFGDRKGTIL